MTKRGILVSPNIKPGMLLVHPMLEEMKEKGMFLPASEDNPGQDGLAVGTWWGGPGLFVDYTKESTRQHWKQYIKDALLQYGCRSLWNDDCGLLMSFYLFRMPVLYCHTILLLIYTFCLLLSSILVCAVI